MAKIYCCCAEASLINCTNENCKKYKEIKPYRCLCVENWQKKDNITLIKNAKVEE